MSDLSYLSRLVRRIEFQARIDSGGHFRDGLVLLDGETAVFTGLYAVP